MLNKHGADVRKSDGAGETPLHSGARGGSEEVAQLLLDHGADINAKDAISSTPLFDAKSYRKDDMVNFLIGQGADASLTGHLHFEEIEDDAGHKGVIQLQILDGASLNGIIGGCKNL
ncbi:ankyrin repeat-containing domain protein [Halenospora varia]|nr:ankyrin repeat-containing domain protein [Halenospora varia]